MQLWRNTAGGGSSHFLIRLNIQVWGIPESDSAGCPTLHGITRALGWGKPIVVETPITLRIRRVAFEGLLNLIEFIERDVTSGGHA